jgi:hypothetical protein
MVTHLHILFIASHNTTTVQSFNYSCTRTVTSVDAENLKNATVVMEVTSTANQPIATKVVHSQVELASNGEKKKNYSAW